MKNVRFYLDYNNPYAKRMGNHEGNVTAVLVDVPSNLGRVAALSAVYYYPNSPVCFGEVSLEYLSTHCKRISEVQARKIHPLLFVRLDSEL